MKEHWQIGGSVHVTTVASGSRRCLKFLGNVVEMQRMQLHLPVVEELSTVQGRKSIIKR